MFQFWDNSETGFIGLHLLVCAIFEKSIHTQWVLSLQVNHLVSIYYGLQFGFNGSKPLLRVRPLHCIPIGDRILVNLIELNRIAVPDLDTEVSVQLMRYSTRSP